MKKRRQTSSEDSASDSTEEQAVQWLVRRMNATSWSQGDEAALRAWREQDPEHEREFREAEIALGMMSSAEPKAAMKVEDIAQETRKKIRARNVKRRTMMAGAAAVIASAAGYGVHWQRRKWLSTGIGETREWTLEDGTRVILDAHSQLRVSFTRTHRTVRLEYGGGIFEVARGERPFRVQAGPVEVRDIGTTFDVHSLQQPDAGNPVQEVEITVSEGLVEVAPLTGKVTTTWRVMAGEQLLWSDDAKEAPTPRKTDLRSFGSWRQHVLIYRDRPLVVVLADLQRHTKEKIILSDPELGQFRIRATLHSSDTGRALEILSQVAPLAVSHSAAGEIIIRRKR